MGGNADNHPLLRKPPQDSGDRRCEVAVTGDDDGHVVAVVVCVLEETNGDVDVGLFLFVGLSAVLASMTFGLLGQEVPVVDVESTSGKQSVEVGSLAFLCSWIIPDPCREVSDTFEFVGLV